MIRIPADDILRFAREVLRKVGATETVAEDTARALWHTSLRGVDSHGIRLLPHYVAGLEEGRLNPQPQFVFEKTMPSIGVLDADHTLGHAAGCEAMRQAIKLAWEAGVGLVAVKNSSHCGAMAYYALQACEEDMVGLAFTHATSKLRTPNTPRPFFGINPICFAAPMQDEGAFCFDSAPSPFSNNKVKQYREDGRPLPAGTAADAKGEETIDASLAMQLLPIGDYKGFGWAMMVDILCGLLSGMPVGRDISDMYGSPLSEKRHLGQFFGAIRIDAFEDISRFKMRLQETAERVRREPRVDPTLPVQVPGDPEKACEADRAVYGIPIKNLDFDKLRTLAQRLNIKSIAVVAS